ncbi:extracellular solute-binding protein, partial [Gracilibacillus orientalis]
MRKNLLFLLGFLLVLFLVACGNEDGTEETGGETSEGTAEEENTDDITLRIAWWGEQTRNDYTLEVIELFEEKNPGITIEPEYASWDDYWQKLSPQAAANELPDIIAMDQSYISQYSQNGQLADLSPFIGNEIDVSNIPEDVVNTGEINDGLYGFNLGVNALGFQYNPEVLSEIGVDTIPEEWTWDDFMEISDKAVEAGYYFDNGHTADVILNYYLRTQGKR